MCPASPGRIPGLDLEFIRTLLSVEEAHRDPCPDFRQGIHKAAAWLMQRGCAGNDGLIAILGRAHAGSLLLACENFVPAWKEAVGAEGFEGRFNGFLVWQGRLYQESVVIALDLRDVRPLHIRAQVLGGSWADVSLRELTDEDLDEIRKARGDEFDEMRERQNCVADITVYAQFEPPEPQQLSIIPIEQGEQNSPPGAGTEEPPPDEEGA